MVFNEGFCAQGNFKFSRIRVKFSQFPESTRERSNFQISQSFQRFLKIENSSFERNKREIFTFKFSSSLKLTNFILENSKTKPRTQDLYFFLFLSV